MSNELGFDERPNDRGSASRDSGADSVTNITWQTEVDTVDADAWGDLLDQFDDATVYQSAAYGEVRWGKKNISRLVLRRNGVAVGLAQLRLMRATPLKCGIGYLRWGPLWQRRDHPFDPTVPERLAQAIELEYVKRRGLFVRILPNAFTASPRAEMFRTAFSQFACESSENKYRTFVVDLTPSLEDLRKSLDKKWRNQLTRSEKNNLTVTSGRGMEDFLAFCDMYAQMRKRKSFETTVDIEEFKQIQEALPESQRMHVLICKENGVSVAGLVASVMGDSAIYLLGATSDDGLQAKGAYLLQWTMISQLKESRIRYYDLGGIDPDANPGVFHFKKGLSGADVCQIMPLCASQSILSAAIVKVASGMQRTIRATRKPFTLTRNSRRPVAIS